jgi:hypothetical protein
MRPGPETRTEIARLEYKLSGIRIVFKGEFVNDEEIKFKNPQ